MLEVEAFLHPREQGFEQAFLDRKGQGHQQRDIGSRPGVHALQFGAGEDFAGQALGPLGAEQVLEVDARALPLILVSHPGGCTTVAMGDAPADMRRPHRRAVITDAGGSAGAVQLQQGGPGTEAAGEEFRLAFDDGALNTRRLVNCTAGKVICSEVVRVETGTEPHAAGQRMGQRPVGAKWRAAGRQGGESVHAGHFAGSEPRWVVGLS